MQSIPGQPHNTEPHEVGEAKTGNRKRFKNRKPLGDTPFFSVPIALYDTGLARCLRPAEFKRYCTLLRVGNYHYGSDKITADLRELRKLDGISERGSWGANRTLKEYGLIQVLKTRPFTYFLFRPESWHPPRDHGPKITRAEPLKVAEKDLRPPAEETGTRQEMLVFVAKSASNASTNCR